MTKQSLIIRQAELLSIDGSTTTSDIRIAGSIIQAVGDVNAGDRDHVVEAAGNLLIPGLHDHHVHLASYAASLASVRCGPPDVQTEQELAGALRDQPGNGWLRGTGFHESVVPELDRKWLDARGPDRPIRIQHRSGRLWILNSRGLDIIERAAVHLPAHERVRLESPDGRLYDIDELLGELTRSQAPPVDVASRHLAASGVTGINDMTPSNNPESRTWFNELQSSGVLLQKVRLSGRPDLTDCHAEYNDALTIGETKIHLHDSSLPEFPELVEVITSSHQQNRNVAVHCVTELELVFTLSAFRVAGTSKGDRIEHASVVPPALIEQLRELELGIVTQPNFIAERGDAYIRDVPRDEHPFLYRVRSLIDVGVSVAFGTDLPFGNPDPWLAMSAATERRTLAGEYLGEAERITPESALMGFLGDLANPFTPRPISAGEPADLCLLDVPWQDLRSDLSSAHVRMTFRDGEVIYAR